MHKRYKIRSISNHGELPKELFTGIMEDFLTPKQAAYAKKYYFEGKDMAQIGKEAGVHPTTVSRTLIRARKKLEAVLRYTFAK